VSAENADLKRGGGPRPDAQEQIAVIESEVSTVVKALATLTNLADKGIVKDERTRTVSTISNAS
jgi:hypothetical protein